MGAAMDRRDREVVQGCTVRATPDSREAQGILIRRMRIRTSRPAQSRFGYFFG
jgi:hypothetical protein